MIATNAETIDVSEVDASTGSRPLTEVALAEASRYSLLIEWSPEDGLYLASCPELPGAITHGRTQEEALAMGVEAVATWLDALRADGEPIPAPSPYRFRDRFREDAGAKAPVIRDEAETRLLG